MKRSEIPVFPVSAAFVAVACATLIERAGRARAGSEAGPSCSTARASIISIRSATPIGASRMA